MNLPAPDSSKSESLHQQLSINLSLAIGFIMLAGKWYAYLRTGSAAILSDAAESVVHIIAVAFAAYSKWLSFKPPDESHPYGHDRIAFFSAGFEGSMIILAALVSSMKRYENGSGDWYWKTSGRGLCLLRERQESMPGLEHISCGRENAIDLSS